MSTLAHSLACTCPEMPAMGPRDPIPTGPVTCVCCGHPLELSCVGKCGKVDESIAETTRRRGGSDSETRRAPSAVSPLLAASKSAGNAELTPGLTGRRKETRPRHFADRVCACGATFTPHWTGAKQCPACVAAKAVV